MPSVSMGRNGNRVQAISELQRFVPPNSSHTTISIPMNKLAKRLLYITKAPATIGYSCRFI